jgi:hypothetical protein
MDTTKFYQQGDDSAANGTIFYDMSTDKFASQW